MTCKKLREVFLTLVPAEGTPISNGRLRQAIGEQAGRDIDEDCKQQGEDRCLSICT